MECLFCKIAAGQIRATVVHQDADVVAFRDISPQAPTHIVIIPRRHIASVKDLGEGDAALMGKLILAAKRIAREMGVDESGYRLVMNTGRDAGQSVFHLHMHLLAGRALGWPPG